jgi:hypothetical protein
MTSRIKSDSKYVTWVRLMSPECPDCRKRTTFTVKLDDWNRYRQGALCQAVWPGQTPEWRENLITGFHPACWMKVFD